MGDRQGRMFGFILCRLVGAPPRGSYQPVEVSGQVIWCRREGLSYQAGIHFAAAPDALEAILTTIP